MTSLIKPLKDGIQKVYNDFHHKSLFSRNILGNKHLSLLWHLFNNY